MDTIDLFEAIRQMRMLTQQGKTFSFIHVAFNRDTRSTEGIRQVRRARLRPAAKGDDVSNAHYKLFYYEEDTQMPRNCWQMLILAFNGIKVVLN